MALPVMVKGARSHLTGWAVRLVPAAGCQQALSTRTFCQGVTTLFDDPPEGRKVRAINFKQTRPVLQGNFRVFRSF